MSCKFSNRLTYIRSRIIFLSIPIPDCHALQHPDTRKEPATRSRWRVRVGTPKTHRASFILFKAG